MKITAAVTEAEGAPSALQELDVGDLRPDEVQVRVVATGICHTDLIVRDQWYPVPLPAVLGHEGAGIVERVGDAVRSCAVGDRVGVTFDSCGRCRSCATGRPSYCHGFFERNFLTRRPADGSTALSRRGEPIGAHYFGQSSFATHAVAGERNVVRIEGAIPLEVAAPFGCGIQTGAGAVLNTLRAPAGSIIAIDVNAERLELARELGAEVTLDVNTILTGGRTVRGIVECDSVSSVFLPILVRLWEAGRFPADRLITTYDLDQIDEAAEDGEAGRTIKPVLMVDAPGQR
jgi:aryl-alcohol dehydrogenase